MCPHYLIPLVQAIGTHGNVPNLWAPYVVQECALVVTFLLVKTGLTFGVMMRSGSRLSLFDFRSFRWCNRVRLSSDVSLQRPGPTGGPMMLLCASINEVLMALMKYVSVLTTGHSGGAAMCAGPQISVVG